MNRKRKALFYSLSGPLMRLNGAIYRRFRAPRGGRLRVQLGPGQRNYIPGWLNLDANMFTGKCDVWADLRNPLPFHDSTVEALYSHHVVEHLPDLAGHFREAYRVLCPGGVYRVGGPHGDQAMRKYLEGDYAWFSDFPDARRSLGGRLENFIFCRQEHLTILTPSFLGELLSDAGFSDFATRLPVRETGYPELFAPCLEREGESDFESPHTLVVEARKPVDTGRG